MRIRIELEEDQVKRYHATNELTEVGAPVVGINVGKPDGPVVLYE